MIRTMLIATLLWASTAAAQAPPSAPPAGADPVFLPAMATCSEWYAERQGRSKYRWQNEVLWFEGFIAGHNTYVQRPANKMIQAEPNDVALWLDSYCEKNPTSNVAQAATAYAAAHGGLDPLNEVRGK